jgi:hypothetical protein
MCEVIVKNNNTPPIVSWLLVVGAGLGRKNINCEEVGTT